MSQFQSDPASSTAVSASLGRRPGEDQILVRAERGRTRPPQHHAWRADRRLPATLIAGLTCSERRDLARAFGRPLLRRTRARRPA